MKTTFNLVLVALVLTAAITGHVSSHCQSQEEALKRDLLTAFKSVAEAECKGADISGLVDDLNHALNLLDTGGAINLAEAETLIKSVLAEAPVIEQLGIISTRNQHLQAGIIISLVAVSAVVAWQFGPRGFWSIWLRSKRDWRVHT